GAVAEELGSRSLDVGDDEVEKLGRAGGRRSDARAEDDRARRARGRELKHAAAALSDVGVLPPAELLVELRHAVDVRDRDDDDLELHVDFPGARAAGHAASLNSGGTHGCLLSSDGFAAFAAAQSDPGLTRLGCNESTLS